MQSSINPIPSYIGKSLSCCQLALLTTTPKEQDGIPNGIEVAPGPQLYRSFVHGCAMFLLFVDRPGTVSPSSSLVFLLPHTSQFDVCLPCGRTMISEGG